MLLLDVMVPGRLSTTELSGTIESCRVGLHQSSLSLSIRGPPRELRLHARRRPALARGRRPGYWTSLGEIISFLFLPFFPMTTRVQNFTSNSGPQHPAAHGVSRSVLEMNGEVVERAEPHIGSLQCGTKPLMPRGIPCLNPCPEGSPFSVEVPPRVMSTTGQEAGRLSKIQNKRVI